MVDHLQQIQDPDQLQVRFTEAENFQSQKLWQVQRTIFRWLMFIYIYISIIQ